MVPTPMVPTLLRGNPGLGRSSGPFAPLERCRLHSHAGAWERSKFFVPQPAEHLHIAACLTSLDDLIAAQTLKLAALKTHKKGLMQQLFPVPDEVRG